jgi:hypothetical protein
VAAGVYKARLLKHLLGFVYPERGEPICSPDTLNECPNTAALRQAVVDVLKASIGKRRFNAASIPVLEQARSEYGRLAPGFNGMLEPILIERGASIGHNVVSHLMAYFGQIGHVGAICERCDTIFITTRRQQRYCSDSCRWEYWNEQKAQGYYVVKSKAARDHAKRMKAMKAKGGKR